MRIIATLVAAAEAALPLASASAEPVTVRIAYGDLDLRDPAAVEQLRKRSVRAITRACRKSTPCRSRYSKARRLAVTRAGNAMRLARLAVTYSISFALRCSQ